MSAVVAINQDAKPYIGFWIYLMTDCILFASLFATYAVLRDSTFGGPSGQDLFSLPFVLAETLILLTSSFACGLGVLAARARNKKQTLIWLGVTFLLGLAFLGLELKEFGDFIAEDSGPGRSAFLSAFFTLVGTHGLHISVGLLWMAALVVRIVKEGLSNTSIKRLVLFSLFWHFLDVVWIFIFSIVYLMGVI